MFHLARVAVPLQVPPGWRDTVLPPLPGLPDLTVYGTGFKEHGCGNGWCGLNKDWPSPNHKAAATLATGSGAHQEL